MNCDTNKLFKSDAEILSYTCDVEEVLYHNKNHAVLFELPLSANNRPHESPEKWDGDHVRMPYSSESKYVEMHNDNKKTFGLRWEFIQGSLLREYKSSFEIEKAIKSYNSRYESIWLFDSFHRFVNRDLDYEQRDKFLQETFPKIVNLALLLPDLIKCPIPLLKKRMNTSITMTQEQAACILANAFLCTFPRRNTTKQNSEYSNYPGINFHKLFNAQGESSIEKIKCIVNYFERVTANMPQGNITFTRQSIEAGKFPIWREENKTFRNVKYTITSKYKIEEARQMLQVDFANKAIGGGVIGNGCVQEEIRFCINPELIVARLFTECLGDNESFFVIGTEQFSTYSGYASNFKFFGNFVDFTPTDQFGRKKTRIVAIDALSYRNVNEQFKAYNLTRELDKAYAGFYYPSPTCQVIATGLWGCGAFGGHPIKSALIQLMVCCLVEKPVLFSTYGDTELEAAINKIFKFLIENSVSIGRLFDILRQFSGNSLLLISFIEENVKQSQKGVVKANENIQPLKQVSSGPKTQPITNFYGLKNDPKPQNKPFQFPRFDPKTCSPNRDKKKLESFKSKFANLPKDEDSSEEDNSPKDVEKKTKKKTALLDALNDFF